jgi:hypothetical protein
MANNLTSQWGTLSPHLIADFFQVDNDNVPIGNTHVLAPLTDASMEIALNWQSPFENSGAETKAPALMAMLQSGSLEPLMAGVKMLFAGGNGEMSAADAKASRDHENSLLSKFAGRSGMTKLNSTQVFTGMPPIKIQVTALFRAWRDPVTEVEVPYDQLMQWALPEEISLDGTPLNQVVGAANGQKIGVVELLMPSKTPVKIAMRYKNRMYGPLVIESITNPLASPIDHKGNFTEMLVPMTLCTLTALDRRDWTNTRKQAM